MDADKELLLRFEASCREAGLKLTHQRMEIYRELALSADHPSAETLYKRLKERMPTISPDTVYRTLATFNRYGLAHKVETGESLARFEAAGEQHHHLICRQCSEIVDFLWESVDEMELPRQVEGWGKIESRHVVVYGKCGKCSKR